MATSREGIIAAQLEWARSAGLEPDGKGYLPSYQDNLFQPLSAAARAAFEKGSGSELVDKPSAPAKMRALHSSSALAANAFDFWATHPNRPLLNALGLPDTHEAKIRFEDQYPTGLPGNPPNLDVVLELATGELVGIESKFTEWLSPKSPGAKPFKDKYFPEGQGVWERSGLASSQQLAGKIQAGEVQFRHLDAGQLLKHALGLACRPGTKFRLFYLYFDCDNSAGELHRSEIGAFASAVGPELGFQAHSYQRLFSSLIGQGAGSEAYRSYVSDRYLR